MKREEAEAKAQALMDAFWHTGMSEHELRDAIETALLAAAEAENRQCEAIAREAISSDEFTFTVLQSYADAIAARRAEPRRPGEEKR